jgi:predicted nucleic acid-binding protein
MASYVDSSALVKLVVNEPQSTVLRRHLVRRQLVSSALARTEVIRAVVLSMGAGAVPAGRRALLSVDLLRISDRVLNLAATIVPPQLHSLDAIHLATAEQLRAELTELITYDPRMADAARRLGHRVVAPA